MRRSALLDAVIALTAGFWCPPAALAAGPVETPSSTNLATPGTALVTVLNPGGVVSASFTFTVLATPSSYPVPSITSLSPPGFEAGHFVKPTVFVNVKNDMTIAQEEIFGPVLCVIAYDSEDEAIRIANDSKYGLHGAVLGADLQRARRVASQIRAGRVVINGMTDDPQAPWGGFKYSGVGREYGRYGIEAFLETRAILES